MIYNTKFYKIFTYIQILIDNLKYTTMTLQGNYKVGR